MKVLGCSGTFLVTPISVFRSQQEQGKMAELLLDENTRMRLASVLDGKMCPMDIDETIYRDIQRGVRSAISFRNLAAIAHTHGEVVLRVLPGLRR